MIAFMQKETGKNISISVTAEAKAAIDKFATDNAMHQKEIMSRLFIWFGAQDDLTRKAIMGVLPEGMEVDVARLALQKLAAGGPPSNRVLSLPGSREAAKTLPTHTRRAPESHK